MVTTFLSIGSDILRQTGSMIEGRNGKGESRTRGGEFWSNEVRKNGREKEVEVDRFLFFHF